MPAMPTAVMMGYGTDRPHVLHLPRKDAGTFWFHPHCNTLAHIARGLAGVVLGHEAQNPGFDADDLIQLRDCRIGADGQFIAFTKPISPMRSA